MIFVFDLDDTIYAELTYVRSGFAAVAQHLVASSGGALELETLTAEMEVQTSEAGRGKVFDVVLKRHGLTSICSVDECVGIYRSHFPTLEPFAGAVQVLDYLRVYGCYVVTDGCAVVQQTKAISLGVYGLVRDVLLTSVFGAAHEKPSIRCFEMIAERESTTLSSLCYVADDPTKDFVRIRAEGVATVRVLTGQHANVLAAPGHDAAITIPAIGSFLDDVVRTGKLAPWGFDG